MKKKYVVSIVTFFVSTFALALGVAAFDNTLSISNNDLSDEKVYTVISDDIDNNSPVEYKAEIHLNNK